MIMFGAEQKGREAYAIGKMCCLPIPGKVREGGCQILFNIRSGFIC